MLFTATQSTLSSRTYLHRLYCFSSRLWLTCTFKTITGVSLIAFTPVTPGTNSRAHVRCNRSTAGVLMTYTGCTRCTRPRIWTHLYTHNDKARRFKLSGFRTTSNNRRLSELQRLRPQGAPRQNFWVGQICGPSPPRLPFPPLPFLPFPQK